MPTHVITLGLVPLLAVSFSAQYIPALTSKFSVSTASGDVQITVNFYNKIEGHPIRFMGKNVCLAFDGGECNGKNEKFVGSFALVNFAANRAAKLRERVRVIDQQEHMPQEPTFTMSIAFVDGAASDIQLFGHAKADDSPDSNALWRISRQELFLNDEQLPFLIIHWRYSVDRIILIDIIPGPGTTGFRRVE